MPCLLPGLAYKRLCFGSSVCVCLGLLGVGKSATVFWDNPLERPTWQGTLTFSWQPSCEPEMDLPVSFSSVATAAPADNWNLKG